MREMSQQRHLTELYKNQAEESAKKYDEIEGPSSKSCQE